MPQMRLDRIGYGAGTRDLEQRPNLHPSLSWRKNVGHRFKNDASPRRNRQRGYYRDQRRRYVAGDYRLCYPPNSLNTARLIVFLIPIFMKKGRPATQITVLCPTEHRDTLIELLLTETTTFGVRLSSADRIKLRRDFVEVETQWGAIQAKRGYLNGTLIKTVPEYEDCKRLAEQNNVPLRQVYTEALSNLSPVDSVNHPDI